MPYGDIESAYGSISSYQFSSKRGDGIGIHYFGARYYDPELGRWLSPDPVEQFHSPYSYAANSPLVYVDPDGRFVWFIVIGAAIGATAGGFIAENNGVDWWKGSIAGAFIGAGVGAYAASGFGAEGILTTGGEATKAWGTTTSIINSANVNMGFGLVSGGSGEDLWKFGTVGAASGAFSVTGGLGLAEQGFGGRLAYQGISTTGQSIGNNWARGDDPFGKFTVGLGPVNLTAGRNMSWGNILRIENNWGNVITNGLGIANRATGGDMQFDKQHLTFRYHGGWLEKYSNGNTGAYSVLGDNLDDDDKTLAHELNHVWLSRAMNNQFVFNYGLQALSALSLGRSPITNANYFEQLADSDAWGYNNR